MVPWKIITISGKSGVGKSTLVQGLHRHYPGFFREVRSYTTRPPRPTDDAFFRYVSEEEFAVLSQERQFVWTVEVHGYRYGTQVDDLKDAVREEGTSLMIVTPDAVELMEPIIERDKRLHLYILSPGEAILRARLKARGDTPEAIDRRLADCQSWDRRARASSLPFHFLTNKGTENDLVEQAIRHF